MNTNRKFKNGVFTTLFDNPDLLRDLYCALKGVSLPPDVPVSINTLENVLYSRKKISIPWPEFFVLYNGKEEFPDQQVYRLSELFEKPEDLELTKNAYPLLELEIKILNINEGRNEVIVNRCRKLGEYSVFMA